MLGGGAGHIQDMNNRMRSNKALRNKRRSTKEKHNQIDSSTKGRNKPLKFNSNTVQYNKVKKRINQRRKKDARITRIVFWVSVLVIILLLVFLLVDWNEE
jgi:uncharacterized membrane protein YvbJ